MRRPLFPDVVVDGTAIPAAEIAAEAQNHAAPSTKPGWAWHAAARALAVRELLRQEASRRGVRPDPRPLPGGRRETEEEATIRQLLEAELDLSPPSESELRAAYAAAPDRFRPANSASAMPFDIVRDRIAAAIERRRWSQAARAYIARLVEAATIEGVSFDAETLRRQRPDA